MLYIHVCSCINLLIAVKFMTDLSWKAGKFVDHENVDFDWITDETIVGLTFWPFEW